MYYDKSLALLALNLLSPLQFLLIILLEPHGFLVVIQELPQALIGAQAHNQVKVAVVEHKSLEVGHMVMSSYPCHELAFLKETNLI